jgi:hypothetical protein
MGAVLYILCFPNGKLYVGITTKTAGQRFQEHCRSKYAVGNVQLAILHSRVSWPEAKTLEKWDLTNNENGYNLTMGGDGVPGLSVESRDRIAVSRQGKPMALESRQKLRECNRGKVLTPATRAKMARRPKHVPTTDERAVLSAKMKGRTFSEEHRKRLSESQKRRFERERGMAPSN